MNIYAGTSGFGYKEWKGKFYPEKISPGEMLRFYADRFNSVEINNTFYRMPSPAVLASWSEQVPGSFVFALKAPQVITHIKRLKHVDQETSYFFKTVSVFGEKLGPILFQFPKSFKVDPLALEDFLDLIPDDRKCAFEFRGESRLDKRIHEPLRAKGCSLCMADTDDDPLQDIISTARWGYLRLRRSDYSDADLARWTERISSEQWQQVFVFFKHEEGAKGPKMAKRFREIFDARLKKKFAA